MCEWVSMQNLYRTWIKFNITIMFWRFVVVELVICVVFLFFFSILIRFCNFCWLRYVVNSDINFYKSFIFLYKRIYIISYKSSCCNCGILMYRNKFYFYSTQYLLWNCDNIFIWPLKVTLRGAYTTSGYNKPNVTLYNYIFLLIYSIVL